MEAALMARGMGCAYPSIVTPHGEILHSERYDARLADGDLLLADVGAETPGGWAGDVTRTWPVSGRYSSTQREIYEVVLAAQKQAIAAVTPGSRYRNVHVLACQALAAGLADLGILRGNPIELAADGVVALLFPHGVGHLLGLDVHDMEDLGDRAGYAPGRERAKMFGLRSLRLDRDLEPGMAVTIEPGFYISPAILGDPALTRVARRSARSQAAGSVRRRARHPDRGRRARHRHRPRGADRRDPEDHRRRRSRDGRVVSGRRSGAPARGSLLTIRPMPRAPRVPRSAACRAGAGAGAARPARQVPRATSREPEQRLGAAGATGGDVAGAGDAALGAAWTSARRAGDPVGGNGSSVVPGGGAAAGAAARSGAPARSGCAARSAGSARSGPAARSGRPARSGAAARCGRKASSGRTAASPGSGSVSGDRRIGGSIP